MFYEKGYDGSRVDEIVKIANVNKSSIYYYFKGKEDILMSLLEKSANDIYRKKAEIIDQEHLSDAKLAELSETIFKSNQFLELLKSKKELFSISLIESLKNSSDSSYFFQLVSKLYEDSLPVKYTDLADGDRYEKLLVREFFFVSLPGILFSIMGDKFAEFFKIDKDRMEKDFMDSVFNVYLNLISKELTEGTV